MFWDVRKWWFLSEAVNKIDRSKNTSTKEREDLWFNNINLFFSSNQTTRFSHRILDNWLNCWFYKRVFMIIEWERMLSDILWKNFYEEADVFTDTKVWRHSAEERGPNETEIECGFPEGGGRSQQPKNFTLFPSQMKIRELFLYFDGSNTHSVAPWHAKIYTARIRVLQR